MGLSNFSVEKLDQLAPSLDVVPAVNQVRPYLMRVDTVRYSILSIYSPLETPPPL